MAENILGVVTNITRDVLDLAENELNTIIDELDKIKEGGDAYAKEVVDKELAEIRKLIDDFKNNTDGVAKEVLECVEGVEGDVEALEVYALNASTACTDGAVKAVVSDILPILEAIKEADEQLAAEKDALDLCKNELIPITCINNVVNDLITIVSKVPSSIENDVAKIKSDFEVLEEKLENCANDVVPEVVAKAATLVDDFSACLQQ